MRNGVDKVKEERGGEEGEEVVYFEMKTCEVGHEGEDMDGGGLEMSAMLGMNDADGEVDEVGKAIERLEGEAVVAEEFCPERGEKKRVGEVREGLGEEA